MALTKAAEATRTMIVTADSLITADSAQTTADGGVIQIMWGLILQVLSLFVSKDCNRAYPTKES